jgi:Ca2+-transporting ATPase
MTVKRIWLPTGTMEVTGTGYDPAGHFEQKGSKIDPARNGDLLALCSTGLHCNHSQLIKVGDQWTEVGEPTEAALVVMAYKAWLDPLESSQTVMEIPFSSKRKRMVVIEKDVSGLIAHVKGAPEIILERCTRILVNNEERDLLEADRQLARDAIQEFSQGSLRTLALARRGMPHLLDEEEVENELTLLGIVGIMDPPHPEVPGAVQMAGEAGIRVIMITGDNPMTGMSIAEQVGLKPQRAITGNELDRLDDARLRDILQEDILYARTAPEHKMSIVKVLQQMGEIVGMTGDGVNDAPALKQADIGIAMGMRGTDVAKGASDMILTDDNFASIINAVEEGRREYDNIKKFVRYLMSSNMGEVVAIFLNILLGGPLILLPVQILWMNLITDGVTALALAMEPAESDIMKRPPRKAGEQILNRASITMILLVGGYIGLATLGLFYFYLGSGEAGAAERAQTMAFAGIILIQMITIFNFRALHAPITRISFLSNPWVLAAWAGNLLLQIAAVHAPFMQGFLHTTALELHDWALILAVALPVFVMMEVYKGLRWKQ